MLWRTGPNSNVFLLGFNVTLTVKMHEGSIPSQPALGKALSAFEIKIPVPKLATPHLPGDGDDGDDDTGDSPSFIDHATVVHILLRLLSSFRIALHCRA